MAERADGEATIETFTVVHRRGGRRRAVVVGRFDDDGRRFLATGLEGDDADADDLLGLLADEQPVGRRIRVRATEAGRLAASTSAVRGA